jgi:hypothetical protein
MKNKLLVAALALGSLPTWASDDALFQEAFSGMFDPTNPPIEHRAADPKPTLPLDGRWLLFLASGIAAARKRLRA